MEAQIKLDPQHFVRKGILVVRTSRRDENNVNRNTKPPNPTPIAKIAMKNRTKGRMVRAVGRAEQAHTHTRQEQRTQKIEKYRMLLSQLLLPSPSPPLPLPRLGPNLIMFLNISRRHGRHSILLVRYLNRNSYTKYHSVQKYKHRVYITTHIKSCLYIPDRVVSTSRFCLVEHTGIPWGTRVLSLLVSVIVGYVPGYNHRVHTLQKDTLG